MEEHNNNMQCGMGSNIIIPNKPNPILLLLNMPILLSVACWYRKRENFFFSPLVSFFSFSLVFLFAFFFLSFFLSFSRFFFLFLFFLFLLLSSSSLLLRRRR